MGHSERVARAEAAAIRETEILNAAADCLVVDDPLEGLDSRWPEGSVDPDHSIARSGYRARFLHAGVAYTVIGPKSWIPGGLDPQYP